MCQLENEKIDTFRLVLWRSQLAHWRISILAYY